MNHKQICLMELNKTDRPKRARMKTPNWTEKVFRPTRNGNQALLSYEIYRKAGTPSERNTIKALNELIGDGEAKQFFHKELLWYVKKAG